MQFFWATAQKMRMVAEIILALGKPHILYPVDECGKAPGQFAAGQRAANAADGTQPLSSNRWVNLRPHSTSAGLAGRCRACELLLAGRYLDEFDKRSGNNGDEWRISKRMFVMDWSLPLPDQPGDEPNPDFPPLMLDLPKSGHPLYRPM